MPITNVITHHIQKVTDEDAILSLRNSELENNAQQSALFETLRKSFNTRVSRKHGSFEKDKESILLAKEANTFLQDKTKFQALSISIMTNVETVINTENGELNAHFIFFIESNEKTEFLYLFIVNQNEYLTINSSLDITPIHSIDTGSSLSGLKLNINDWKQRPKYHYLTLVPPKGNEILSDALHDISGFGNKIDKTKSTKEFLDNVNNFTKHVPEDKKAAYHEKVIEYCEEQEAKDEPVHIPTLSQSLEGIDCEKFIREMLPHNPVNNEAEPDDELMIDKRSLRRYVKFSGRDKDLSITFSTNQLSTSIFFDEKADTLLVQNIPKSLRKQLLAHLKKIEQNN